MTGDRLWRLDVITRAVSESDPIKDSQQAAFVQVLGLSSWSPGATSGAGASEAARQTGAGDADQIAPIATVNGPPGAKHQLNAPPDDTPPERTRFYKLPAPDSDGRPQWYDTAQPLSLQPKTFQRPAPAALFPKARARSVIGATLKVLPHPIGVDIPAVVRALSAGRPLKRLPMRKGWRFTRSVRVLLDRSSAMAPYRTDVQALLDTLARLLGADHIDVQPTSGWPGTQDDPPHEGAVCLIVSGLGLLPAEVTEPLAPTKDWARYATAMKRRGWTCVALTPARPAVWPMMLTRALSMVHWAEGTNARQVRGAALGQRLWFAPQTTSVQADQVQHLAELAAMSARLDRPTLRRLRRYVGGVPALEADLWWSPHVSSRGETGITLRDAARAKLQSDFAGRKDHAADLRALRRHHLDLPAHFVFEEQATALVVTQPDGWSERLRDLLQSATRTIVEGSTEVRQFALWMLKVLGRLEMPEALHPEAAALYHAACKRTGAVARNEEAPGRLRAPSWLTPRTFAASGPQVALCLDWRAQGVSIERLMSLKADLLRDSVHVHKRKDPVRRVAFSPDGKWIAAGCRDGSVHLLDHTDYSRRQMHGHQAEINGLTFSANGTELISACADGWLGQDGTTRDSWAQTQLKPDMPLWAVAAHPRGGQVAVSAGDGAVYVVEPASGKVIASIGAMQATDACRLCYSPDGRYLFVARFGALYRYETRNYATDPAQADLFTGITNLVCPAQGGRLFVGCEDGTVAICDIETLIIEQRYMATENAPVTCLAAPDSGRWGIVGTERGVVAVFDGMTGHEVMTFPVATGAVVALALNRAGTRVAIVRDGISIYRLEWAHTDGSEGGKDIDRHPIWPAGRGRAMVPAGEANWLRATPQDQPDRARTLTPGSPPARLGAAHWLDLKAPDDSQFRLEDADQADARRPLHIGVLLHPSDVQRAAPVLDALEEKIRAHAGLPDMANVLQQDLILFERSRKEDEAIEHAFSRAKGKAAIVVLASGVLARGKGFEESVQRLDQMLQSKPMGVEVVYFDGFPEGESHVRNLLERAYEGPLFGRDLIARPQQNIPMNDNILYVIELDAEMSSNDAYCEAIEQFVRTINARGDGGLLLPVHMGPQQASFWVADRIPTLWEHAILHLDSPDDPSLLRRVKQISDGRRRETVIPIMLDDMGESAAAILPEQRNWPLWLSSDQVDVAARRVTDAWRRDQLAMPAQRHEEFPNRRGQAVSELLQAMTMTFHKGRFENQITYLDRDFKLSDINIHETFTTQGAPSPERQQFEHFIFLAEYFHAGPVTQFMQDGIDPWRVPDIAQVIRALETEIVNMPEENPNTPEIDLRRVFRAFRQFAAPHERTELERVFGNMETLVSSTWRDAFVDQTVSARMQRYDHRRLAALLHPYAAPGMGHYNVVPTPVPPPATFVEDAERYQGQFLTYLRGLAGASPDNRALVSADVWESASWLIMESSLGLYVRSREVILPGPEGTKTVSIPIWAFHDFAALLCEEMMEVLRHRLAEGPMQEDVSEQPGFA